LKRILLTGLVLAVVTATSAIAADMPVKMATKAPAMVAPSLSWTGCYVGVNAGYGWGQDDVGIPAPLEGSPKFRGGLGGAQIGCNYQFATSWVAGIEAMYDFASLKGDVIDPSNTAATTASKFSGLGSLTARIGYAFDRSLIYVKGGLGYSRSERTISDSATFSQSTGTVSKFGYVIGGGWEYMIMPNWSAKIEYNHFNFGAYNESVTQLPSGAVFQQDDHNRGVDVVTVGLNFRFH
jgi:outer membrane immunogenic protein